MSSLAFYVLYSVLFYFNFNILIFYSILNFNSILIVCLWFPGVMQRFSSSSVYCLSNFLDGLVILSLVTGVDNQRIFCWSSAAAVCCLQLISLQQFYENVEALLCAVSSIFLFKRRFVWLLTMSVSWPPAILWASYFLLKHNDADAVFEKVESSHRCAVVSRLQKPSKSLWKS